MRIVLIVLSGDAGRARERLLRHYPAAEIESLSRDELEKGSYRPLIVFAGLAVCWLSSIAAHMMLRSR